MNKVNFFSNGSCYNHGCEALYLSLMLILYDFKFTAYTENYLDDHSILDDDIELIDIYEYKNTFVDTLLYKIKYKITKSDRIYYNYKYRPFDSHLSTKNELFLSIGGDNYCYGHNEWLYALNDILIKHGNKIILTGCSIEPDIVDENMLSELKKFTAIIARESLTYNFLLEQKFNNVYLLPDSAFILPKKDVKNIDNNFFSKEIIGINLSPLILNKGKKELILENIFNLLDYIIKKTSYNLLLIPHVMIKNNDDTEILEIIYNKYAYTKRIKFIKVQNACELKGYINKCKIMIAARTHASIAAYSCCIPTLVIGYSIKSKGIATDLFGQYKNYVLPIEQITKENDLVNSFIYINDNFDIIKRHLTTIIPKYKAKCYDLKQIIDEVN